MKPRVYIAGKIGPNDFRHDIVPSLRGHTWQDGPLECRNFIYTGPFFVSCSHRCAHTAGSHGAGRIDGEGCEIGYVTQEEIYRSNQAAIDASDVVFAYIDGIECYGTQFEIGWAAKAGKPIYVCLSPEMDRREFWYGLQAARRVRERIVSREDLPKHFAELIAGIKK